MGKSEPAIGGEMDVELWDSQLDINLKSAAFLCCRAVLPVMEKQGKGAVVGIASTAGGLFGVQGGAHPFQQDDGDHLWAERHPAELRAAGPHVHAACREAGRAIRRRRSEGFVAKRKAAVPISHMGKSWDVAHAALFLASDEAKHVTATELVVDGRLTAATR